MAFAGEEAGRGVETDPAGAGQVDLTPRVEIGEVLLGAGGAVEGFLVRLELDQVAGDETRSEAAVAERLNEEPAGIAAGTGEFRERFLGV